MKTKEQMLKNVKPGFVFQFYRFGTRRLLRTMNLRLNERCGYAELGGAFDSVEKLDSAKVNVSDEIVSVLGKFNQVFERRKR